MKEHITLYGNNRTKAAVEALANINRFLELAGFVLTHEDPHGGFILRHSGTAVPNNSDLLEASEQLRAPQGKDYL